MCEQKTQAHGQQRCEESLVPGQEAVHGRTGLNPYGPVNGLASFARRASNDRRQLFDGSARRTFRPGFDTTFGLRL